jgi:hypothetical protein
MNETEQARLNTAIKQVMKNISASLVAGLEAQETAWILRAYERTVLPFRMRPAAQEPDLALRQRISAVSRSINGSVGRLPPAEKMRVAKQQYYAALLAPISSLASDLARAQAKRETVDGEIQRKAGQVMAHLDAYVNKIEGEPAWLREGIQTELSEALLDCRYAAEAGYVMSLRLHRWLAQR